MSAAFRLIVLLLTGFVCKAQTVTPLSIEVTSGPRCQGRPILFRLDTSQNLSNIVWSVTPSRDVRSIIAPDSMSAALTFNLPVTYTIAVSANGQQPRSGQVVLAIAKSAGADFNAMLGNQGYPAVIYLTSYATNYTGVEWQFDDGTTDNSTYVEKEIVAPGSHRVLLVAKGANGCGDTASYSFYVADSSGITLPNVFTPNLDGVNDVYRPIARGIMQLSARVFNREHTMVHRWNAVNGFWDGRTTSGEPCPDGVYMIVVEAVGFDGKKYNLSSSITLIR